MQTASATATRNHAAAVCSFAFPFGPPSPSTHFPTGARSSF